MSKEQKIAKDNLIALFKVGSHLYGTNTPESDEDFEGLFIEPPEYVIGVKNISEVDLSTNKTNEKNTSEDIDYKLYTVKTFFKLASNANPNKIEWFFIPDDNIVQQHPIWGLIRDNRHLFVSKKLLHSFSGYAMSQRKKLAGKKKRYEELCEFQVILEDQIKKGIKRVGEMDIFETKTRKKYKAEIDRVVEMHYKTIKGDFEWIKYYQTQEGSDCIKINDKIYNWGMDINKIYGNVKKEVEKYGHRTKGLETLGYDGKFAYHLFRLFDGAIELLQAGEMKFPCERAEFYKKIRNGEYSLDELLEMSKDLDEQVHKIAEDSEIPHKPDIKGIDELQQKIYLEYWKEKGLI